jgi:hypothetical protein
VKVEQRWLNAGLVRSTVDDLAQSSHAPAVEVDAIVLEIQWVSGKDSFCTKKSSALLLLQVLRVLRVP